MRTRLLVTVLASTTIGACASTDTRDASSTRCDPAHGLRGFGGATETFADDAAVTAAHPDDDVGALCAEDDETCSRGPMWAFYDDATSSMGLLTVAGESRLRHTGVMASPHHCVDVGTPTIQWFGGMAVVRATTSHVSADPACDTEPSWTLAALVSKDTGRVELLATCRDHEATLTVLPDGERVRFSCLGVDTVVRIDAARACRP